MAYLFKWHIDYIFFIYGFSFLFLSALTLLIGKSDRKILPWFYLGMFAFLHGINELMDLVSFSFADSLLFKSIRLVILLASFLFLAEFGRRGIKSLETKKTTLLIYPAIFILISSLYGYGILGIEIGIRYFAGFLGAVLASIALFVASKDKSVDFRLSKYIQLLGVSLFFYAFFSGLIVPKAGLFPASIINYQVFESIFKFPVQLIRTLLAVCSAFFLAQYYIHLLSVKSPEQKLKYLTKIKRLFWIDITIAVLLGWVFVNLLGNTALNNLARDNNKVASTFVEWLDEDMADVEDAAALTSSSSEVINALITRDNADIDIANKILSLFKHKLNFSAFFVIDLSGYALASSRTANNINISEKNFSQSPFFTEAISGGIGRFIGFGIDDNEKGYYVSSSVKDYDGNIIGAVAVKEDLNNLEEILFNKYPFSFLVDSKGKILISKEDGHNSKYLWTEGYTALNKKSSLVKAYPESGKVFFTREILDKNFVEFNNKIYYVSRKPLSGVSWSIVLLSNTNLISSYRFFAISIAGLIFILIVSFFHSLIRRESLLFDLSLLNKEKEAILDSATEVGIIATDINGIIKTFNKGAEKLLAWKADEVVDKLSPVAFHIKSEINNKKMSLKKIYGADFDGFRVLVENARRGNIERSEWTYITKDGKNVQVDLSVTATKDSFGKVAGFLCIALDISLYKKAQNAIRESEKKLKDVFENVNLIAINLDTEGRLTFCNNFTVQLTGWEKEEILGKNWFDVFLPSSDREKVKKLYKKNITGEIASHHYENDIITKDGRIRTISWSNTIIRDFEGNIISAASLGEDITDRKLAEKKLNEQLDFIQVLMNSIPIPIFYKDTDGIYRGCNTAFELLFRVNRENIIGKTVFDIFPEGPANQLHSMDKSLFNRPGIQIYEYKFQFEVDNPRNLIFHKATYRDPSGNVAGLIGAVLDITERKKAEEALSEAKEFIESAINATVDIFYAFDLKGKLISWNKAFNVVSGYSDQELSVKKPEDFFLGEDIGRISEAVKRIFKAGMAKLVANFVTKDGEQIPYEFTGSVLKDGKGAVIGFSGTGRDLTEHKKFENELKEAKDFLDKIINSIGDPIFVKDSNHKMVLVNEAECQLAGYKKEEVIGKTDYSFFPKEQVDIFWEKDQKVLETGLMDINEETITDRNGSVHSIITKKTLYVDNKGRKYIVGVIRDITELKRNEERLSNLTNCFISFDVDPLKNINRLVKFCNELLESDFIIYFRVKDNKYILVSQWNVPENYSYKDFPEVQVFLNIIKNNIQNNVYIVNDLNQLEFKRIDSNIARLGIDTYVGKIIKREENVVGFLNAFYKNDFVPSAEEKEMLSIIGTAISIEEERYLAQEELKVAYDKLKEAQIQLFQSAKMASIGVLAGGVAHEINNPLTGVLNNIQLTRMIAEKKKVFDYEEFKGYLNAIEESAIRCRNITRALLEMSHTSKGEHKPIFINDVVNKIFNLIEHEMRLSNINMKKNIQPGIPYIIGDPQLLQQVILDIISNSKWAIENKVSKETGSITIKTEYDPISKSVRIRIADNGIGIPKENIGKIFEPFFTTKNVGEGTGLGLSLAYRIVEDHAGHIEVTSEVGTGTIIEISFPAAN